MRPSNFLSARSHAGQRGFSLIELMISLAMVGVLASVAAVTISTEPSIEDEANRIAALVNEASRLAISGGPIDPDASHTGTLARGRFSVREDVDGNQFLLIQRLDDQAGFIDIDRKRVYLGRRVRVVGWLNSAALTSGTGPGIPFFPALGISVNCRPDGTCTVGSDFEPPTGATLYLQDVQQPDRTARVVILPLNGMMTQVFSGW